MTEKEIFFTVEGSLEWDGEDYEVRERITDAIRTALGGGVDMDVSIQDGE